MINPLNRSAKHLMYSNSTSDDDIVSTT